MTTARNDNHVGTPKRRLRNGTIIGSAVAIAGAEAVLEFGLMGCAVGLAHGDGKFGGYPGAGKRQGEGGEGDAAGLGPGPGQE
jgi:hypothetical protein